MDRSYLSHQKVIEASRSFVCIRLATYEDAEEAKVLQRIFVGRSGQLENTTFAILSSDGRRTLTRPGRSPKRMYRSGDDLAETMKKIAGRRAQGSRNTKLHPLPKMATVRLALNVAACDGLPLVVILAKDSAASKKLETRVAKLAWSKEFAGRFVYGSTRSGSDLKAIKDAGTKSGILVVQPGAFGSDGKVLVRTGTTATDSALKKVLANGLAKHQALSKDIRSHIRRGQREGVHWKTQIPVTDPGGPPRRRGRD